MKRLEVHLDRPDMTDPDKWAKIPEIQIAWFRQVCPQLGLDAKRTIVASVLETITSDDHNCFGHHFMPTLIEIYQRHLQIRMDTEINTPEIPEDIRQQLIRVRSELRGIDWKSSVGYTQAVSTWETGAKDYVKQQINSHREYRDMIGDYGADGMTLMPLWNKFLYGRKTARPRTVS